MHFFLKIWLGESPADGTLKRLLLDETIEDIQRSRKHYVASLSGVWNVGCAHTHRFLIESWLPNC